MFASRSLPGISFEVPSAPVDDALPRMDIAAFVGFAENGPLHTPVAVEDVASFRDIFGQDPLLARGADYGERRGYLGDAVEAFFANGGRRAWIVRVAGDSAAHSEFILPGLVDTDLDEVRARTRAPGSWADDLRVSTLARSVHLPLAAIDVAADGGRVDLTLSSASADIDIGDLIELTAREPAADGRLGALVFVGNVFAQESGLRITAEIVHWFERFPAIGSPPELGAGMLQASLPPLTGAGRWQAATGGSPATGVANAERLRFDLLVWRGEQVSERIIDLTFHPAHPRYWAALPDDAALYRIGFGREHREQPAAALLAEITGPRFSLCGPGSVVGDPIAYLPWNMARQPDPAAAESRDATADAPTDTPPVRDGLAAADAMVFLDRPAINASPVHRVLAEAEHVFYRRGEELRGIFSLLPIREASIAAIPDAMHLEDLRPPLRPAAPLDAPLLAPIDILSDSYSAAWGAVAEATSYRLERSADDAFEDAAVVFEGPATSALFKLPKGCQEAVYLRARAQRYGENGPWSNTRVRLLPEAAFADCDGVDPHTLELTLELIGTAGPDQIRLEWTHEDGPADAVGYRVEIAADAEFAVVDTIESEDDTLLLRAPDDGMRYYRVRADIRGAPWSNAVRGAPFATGPAPADQVPNAGPSPRTLAVQCALIRFCAARRDMVAVLSAPRRDAVQDVLDHVRSLAPELLLEGGARRPQDGPGLAELDGGVRPLARDEAEALDYACVYYPWPVLSPGPAMLRTVPPDGAVCGQLAQHAIERGAWIAPANVTLAGALAPEPRLDRDDSRWLRNARINFIREGRGGLAPFDATTLGLTEATRPINVRRLLILLRRLALREGERDVFEPHSIDFRNRVRHRFERALGGLFARGAFAGDTARQAFRVVADDSVNPPDSVDRGRFIVDLQVAPARPLEFLKVRLVQSGPEQLQLEGA